LPFSFRLLLNQLRSDLSNLILFFQFSTRHLYFCSLCCLYLVLLPSRSPNDCLSLSSTEGRLEGALALVKWRLVPPRFFFTFLTLVVRCSPPFPAVQGSVQPTLHLLSPFPLRHYRVPVRSRPMPWPHGCHFLFSDFSPPFQLFPVTSSLFPSVRGLVRAALVRNLPVFSFLAFFQQQIVSPHWRLAALTRSPHNGHCLRSSIPLF